MTRKLLYTLAAALVAACLALPAAAQSLGDAARQAQKDKKPKPASEVVYTNDNIPKSDSLGASQQPPPAATDDKDKTADAANAGDKDKSAASSDEDRKKLEEEWRKKFADAKRELSTLQREYDVAQKEHQLQAAAFYADAGTRLRDDRKWADQEREFQATMADKKSKIDAQKQKIDDLTEELRKAGLPSSWAE